MRHGFAMQHLLVGLMVCLAGTVFAVPGRAQPVGGSVTGGNVTGGNVGVNVGEERRFIVEFQSFTVKDETGCDLCGSDEVQFIIRTPDYALLSSEYGNLDSPLFYRFKRCPQPAVDGDGIYDHEWECDPRGKAPPFSFTVAAYEDDGDLPFTGFCSENIPVVNGRDTDIFSPTATFCVEDRGELIGKSKVELSLEDLSELQAPGQSLKRAIDLIGGCDATQATCGGGGPYYVIRYEVKRLPDAAGGLPVDPNP
jgi:hypothetical protein